MSEPAASPGTPAEEVIFLAPERASLQRGTDARRVQGRRRGDRRPLLRLGVVA